MRSTPTAVSWRCAVRQPSNVGAHSVLLHPVDQGRRADDRRSIDVPAARYPRARGAQQHAADQSLSQRRPARGDVRDRAADRYRGAALQASIRVELRRRNLIPPTPQPYANPLGMTYDSGDYAQRDGSRRWRSPTGTGFPQRRRRSGAARPAARHRASPITSRRPAACRASAPKSLSRREGRDRGRHRHAVERPGPRDELRALRHRMARRRVRERAPRSPATPISCRSAAARIPAARCGCAGIVIGKCVGRDHRQGQEASRRICSRRASTTSQFADGTFHRRGTDRRIGLFEVAARRASRADLPEDLRGQLARRIATRSIEVARLPVRLSRLRGRDRSRRPALVELVRYTAVDDVGRAVNPLILHGQTHGGDRPRHRPGACWSSASMIRESGQLLSGLVHGLCDAARRHAALFRAGLSEVPSPDQSARRPRRRRGRHSRRRSASSSTRSSMRSPIRRHPYRNAGHAGARLACDEGYKSQVNEGLNCSPDRGAALAAR